MSAAVSNPANIMGTWKSFVMLIKIPDFTPHSCAILSLKSENRMLGTRRRRSTASSSESDISYLNIDLWDAGSLQTPPSIVKLPFSRSPVLPRVAIHMARALNRNFQRDSRRVLENIDRERVGRNVFSGCILRGALDSEFVTIGRLN